MINKGILINSIKIAATDTAADVREKIRVHMVSVHAIRVLFM